MYWHLSWYSFESRAQCFWLVESIVCQCSAIGHNWIESDPINDRTDNTQAIHLVIIGFVSLFFFPLNNICNDNRSIDWPTSNWNGNERTNERETENQNFRCFESRHAIAWTFPLVLFGNNLLSFFFRSFVCLLWFKMTVQ